MESQEDKPALMLESHESYTRRMTPGHTNKALDKVLQFYESMDVPLSYRPKLVYTNRHHSSNIGTMAQANITQEFDASFMRELIDNFEKKCWQNNVNVNISTSALEQYYSLFLKAVSIPEKFGKEFDLAFFRPYIEHIYRSNYSSDEIGKLVAHEVWHLIEDEKSLICGHPLIIEGTATYAMFKFLNQSQKLDKTIEDCTMLPEVRYLGAANLVRKYVDHYENPLKRLFDKSVRDDISAEFKDRSDKVMPKFIEDELDLESLKDQMKSQINIFLPFSELRKNITTENILDAYYKIGATKLADELKNQDLTLLTKTYQEAYDDPLVRPRIKVK